jgi:two-component system cell cycle response regulator DivK
MNPPSFTNLHILIVEDDENNRMVTKKLLQVEGTRPENIFLQADDPLPFLRSSLPHGVDLILLDLQLPGKDGYTILAELRADPAFANIPVIAITANVMREDVQRAQEAGFNGFLGKPINGPRFGEQIQRVLSGEKVWAPT